MKKLLLLLPLILSACGGSNYSSDKKQSLSSVEITCKEPYSYSIPLSTEDGIPTVDITTKDIDSDLILEMASLMHCGAFEHQLNGVLISINGDLVFEKYFRGFLSASERWVINYDMDVLHGTASTQKSFQSALLGIAIDQGLLNLETSRLYEFFPEYDYIDWFEPYTFGEHTYTKADITLRNLLTMSAGFEWDEATVHYGDPENTLRIMTSSEDPFRYLFERPLVSPPGEEHVYNTGLSNAITEVIERSTGQAIGDFARDSLFSRIGVDDFYWESGLALRPRDMLKFGQLFLNQGQWDGEQIISSEWVTESLAKEYDFGSGQRTTGYGYQWWWNEFEVDGVRYEAHAALGYGGQQILIFPDFDMVVVFTATEFPRAWGNRRTPYMWMTDFIVPAVVNSILGDE